MTQNKRSIKLFDPALVGTAIGQSFTKLNPWLMIKNPVMFTVEIGTIIMLVVSLYQLLQATIHKEHYGTTSPSSLSFYSRYCLPTLQKP